ncbi:hypothetical protein [Plantactinospora sp. WMMB782]|uniref:hypothetical protein n=1 Tax=Plantactinospora sp. WMMB782 TaxID=3404121 RepID=UPI003B93DD4E
MTQYQVVGQVAHVRTQSPQGPMTRLLYKGSLLPDDVSPEQIRHLLSVKLIAPFGGVGGSDLPGAALPPPIAGQESADDADTDGGNTDDNGGGGPQGGGGTEGSETPFDDPDRTAARSKLPTDGSLPDGRAAHAVWVEAAVARGYAYEAARGTAKPELMDLLRNQQQ